MPIIIKKQSSASIKEAIHSASVQRRRTMAGECRLERMRDRPRRNDPVPRIELTYLPPASLTVARRRLRKEDAEQVERIGRLISEFGFCVPILVRSDRSIVDGHIRLAAARKLELEQVPCIVIDHLDEDEVRLLTIALNRTAELGVWNTDMLTLELRELDALEFDLQLTGFDMVEIDQMLFSSSDCAEAATVDAGDIDAPIVTQPGDLWLMGEHRLLCADATQPDSYARLMGEDQARMVFTDAPYNIPIKGNVSGLGKVKHDDFVAGCGEMSDDEFRAFLQRAHSHAASYLLPGSVLFSCMDWRSSHHLIAAATQAGLHHIQTVVWDKGSGAMGGLYRNAHENILVFCTAAKPSVNNVKLGRYGRDRTNVQHYPGANRPGSSAAEALKLHATPKPVELVEDLIFDVSNRGDVVLDPFMGSGTTIIAAQRVQRRAYGLEIDPRFVDRAVRRWQSLSGQQAIHPGTGDPFDMVADARTSD
jgi:DNA modification methylase